VTAEQNALARVRARIDRLDEEIVALLGRREELVREAGRLKPDASAVRAPERVHEVVARARQRAERIGASSDVVERTYRAIIGAFIELELAATGLADRPVVAPATAADAGELLTLQRAAYTSEARIYGDPELPPLVQTLPELTAELSDGPVLKATLGSRIVGAVRARVVDDVLHVGRLVVAPDHQGHGIGTALLTALEAAAPPAVRSAALFTGDRSTHNLRLYERLGYVEERRERTERGTVLVHLAKRLPAARPA
jgi:chorismate mutase